MELCKCIIYPNNATDNLAVGGTTAASPFYVAALTGNTKVGNLVVSGGNVQLVGVNCTTYHKRRSFETTDASGNVVCGNDDGGGAVE